MPADAVRTATEINRVKYQADGALTGALTILRALVQKDLLNAEDAAAIVTETVAMLEPSHRRNVLAFIATFLPDYQPPHFSAFGQGLAPVLPAGPADA